MLTPEMMKRIRRREATYGGRDQNSCGCPSGRRGEQAYAGEIPYNSENGSDDSAGTVEERVEEK